MPECPHCGSELQVEQTTCRLCGAIASPTTSFEPVNVDDTELGPLTEPIEGPVLIVRKGPQLGERFYLDRPSLSVGRDPSSDIFLNDMTVSREHAVLDVRPERVLVEDAGSLNGTYVNGVCVDEAALQDGDVLQIGTFQMVFHGGQGAR